MSENKKIQLGLCCLNIFLRSQKPSVYSSRRVMLKTIQKKGIDVLKEKIKQNVKDLYQMIQWNEDNGIKVFRISSEMFPHKSNPKVQSYSFDFVKNELKKCKELALKYNQRITMHPGQYNAWLPNTTFINTTVILNIMLIYLI